LRDTRHGLRNEITALAAQVVAGNLQSTKEHAEVKASIEELREDVADLKGLLPRVIELEQHERVDEAREETRQSVLDKLDRQRKWLIATVISVIALVLTAAGILVAVLS